MTNKPTIPQILLIPTLPAKAEESDASQIVAQEIKGIKEILGPSVADEEFKLHVLGEDLSSKTLLTQHSLKDVSVVHIHAYHTRAGAWTVGTSSDHIAIPTATLYRQLSQVRNLQLCILTGLEKDDPVVELLEAQVPILLVLGKELNPTSIVEMYYRLLLRGRSLRQAFQELGYKGYKGLKQIEVSLHPKDRHLVWDKKLYGAFPAWRKALIVRGQSRRLLSWRLRNPLLQKGIVRKLEPTKKAEVDTSPVIKQPESKKQPTENVTPPPSPKETKPKVVTEQPVVKAPPPKVATPKAKSATPPPIKEEKPKEKKEVKTTQANPVTSKATKAKTPTTTTYKPKVRDFTPKKEKRPSTPATKDNSQKLQERKTPNPLTSKETKKASVNPKAKPIKKKAGPIATPVKGPRQKRQTRLTWVAMVLLLLGAGGGIYFYYGDGWGANGAAAIASPCPFPADEVQYCVLVAPFHEKGTCTNGQPELETDIVRMLKSLKTQEGIRLMVRYEPSLCLAETDDLSSYLSACHTDLVIAGTWQSGISPQDLSLKIQYATKNTYQERIFLDGKGARTEFQGPLPGALTDVVLGDLKNLIYWASAIKQQRAGYYDDAVATLEKIDQDRQKIKPLVIFMLTQGLIKGGRYQRALDKFEELLVEEPQNASYYSDRGAIWEQMEWYTRAMADYNQALSLDPENTNIKVSRGLLFAKLGQHQAALQEINELLEKYQDVAALYTYKGQVYEGMNNYSAALQNYEKALSFDVQNADVLFQKAHVLDALDRKDEAAQVIEQILLIEPQHTEANLFEGQMLSKDRLWEEAIESYNLVIARYPSGQAFVARARAFETLDNTAAALDDLAEAVKVQPTLAEAWRMSGKLLGKSGRNREAVEKLSRAIDLRAGNAEIYCLRAQIYTQSSEYNKASADYTQALEIAPNLAKAYYGRAILNLEKGNQPAALQDVAEAIRLAPSDPAPLLVRARIYNELEEDEKASADIRRVITLNPNEPDAYFFRGLVTLRKGDTKAAEVDFERAISLGGASIDAALYLGDAARKDKQWRRALSYYNQAVELAPASAAPYRKRSQYFVELNQYKDALADYNTLMELQESPDLTDYLQRGRIFEALGKHNEALIDYNKALRLSPDRADIHCQKGSLYLSTGKLNKAQEELAKAMKLDPTSAMPYYFKGLLHLNPKPETNDPEKALAAFDQAILLDSTFADAYNKKGELLLKEEVYDEALKYLRKAIRLDDTHADAYTNLAHIARKAGNYALAMDQYTRAITCNPAQPDALYYRGFLHALNGNYSLALADINKSLEVKPGDGLRYGTLAKIYAQMRNKSDMLTYLKLALENGYPAFELKKDPAFSPYQNEAEFQALVGTVDS
ncbi:MAG: tetratricopeptide repeat protein [Bacteroidota bacterium]